MNTTPPRDPRDRAGQHRKASILKRVVLGATVVAFGGGWALVGHHAVGVTSQTAEGATSSGVTTGAPAGPTTPPGLGRADAQGFFSFQPGGSDGGSASAPSAPSAPRARPSIRSRGS